MNPQGDHHRSDECELDHECDQEIQEAIQKVSQQVIHTESNGYELDHESGQKVVQQTNQEQDNRSKSIHSLDEIESQESSGDKGSHGSTVVKIQMISTTRHYRGYNLPFNFRALNLEFGYLEWMRSLLHRRVVAATVAAIDDAAITVDLPIEELFLSRTSTPLPENAGMPDTWSIDAREIAGDPCFFILYGSRLQNGTATFEALGLEYGERLARWSQSIESLQGESSTQALMNFDIDFFIVPEESLRVLTRIEPRDSIRRLCLLVHKNSGNPKDSSNRLSPSTMRRLNRLPALDYLIVFVTNSERAQHRFPEEEFVRYAEAIKECTESKLLRRVHPIQEFFCLLNCLVIVVALKIISFLVSLFESWGLTSLPNGDGQHGKN